MGNSLPSGTYRLGNGDKSAKVQVGSGFLQVTGKSNGEINESWEVLYVIGWRSGDGTFTLTKTKGNTKSPHHDDDEKLDTKIEDEELFRESNSDTYSYVTVERAKTGKFGLSFHHVFNHGSRVIYFPMPTTSTANAQGGITEMIFNFYYRKNGRWKVLIVCELKKKSKDENPYMVTVSRYVACIGNEKDVGFSVAVKSIRVRMMAIWISLWMALINTLLQHCFTCLMKSIELARTWPTSCPRCANSIIQRQPSMSSQSESEESDKDNVPTARLHGRR